MAKKPDLSSLPIGKRLQTRASTQQTAIEQGASARSGSDNDIKTVLLRINRDGWAELRRLSVDTDTPLDTIIINACNDVLARSGRPAIVEKRLPAKKG